MTRTPSRPCTAAAPGLPLQPISRLYAEWLAARAQMAATAAGDEDQDEDGDREGDLARAIMATPAADLRDVLRKVDLLAHYLTLGDEPTLWHDARDEMLLASIRADLLRLPDGESAGL